MSPYMITFTLIVKKYEIQKCISHMLKSIVIGDHSVYKTLKYGLTKLREPGALQLGSCQWAVTGYHVFDGVKSSSSLFRLGGLVSWSLALTVSESRVVVEAGILLSVNDLPAACKIAGFPGVASNFICTVCQLRGKTGVFNTNYAQWIPRNKDKLCHWSTAYRDAQTLDARMDIFKRYGVRWSSFWLLDYWDPTRMLVIDAMHCLLEGICTKPMPKESNMLCTGHGLLYDDESTPESLKLDGKHIYMVAKIQVALCFAIEGDERARHKSKKEVTQFPKAASQKDHFIALLLDWRLKQPHTSLSFILPTGTPDTLTYIWMVIEKTVCPSWLNSVPKNYGDAKAGSIKADEWQTLSTVFFPIVLIMLWGNDDGSAPAESSFLVKALDHTMALFQATILACRRSMTVSRASAYQKYISDWVNGLQTLFPHTHKAGHIYDFLLLFGPVKSWWCFPFKRLIGALQKINMNDHVGGVLEATIIWTITRTANIHCWLCWPDYPEAVQLLKILFDK
ncbi:hypothetical protein BT96DRAFT_945785 [Gymnopus androsaceus JB14]|uniref:Uncharacterized protein n=1 Tax=Gymnopus androsaceus JB14 TaxID=1447944 RepID=A0A6A4GYD9_9AGAR|nr:hypothetical protein BT96DRAFT_945785 [Gymnopus androsaceus JB14]